MARDRHRPGEMHWGWWLRVRDGALEDEDGRAWDSVRDAFWEGELRFDDIRAAPEQHELMLRALSALENGSIQQSESRHDLFNGDMMFWRFYHCWLASIGMIDTSSSLGMRVSPPEGRLTLEGMSVLLMLRATRDPEWESLPMAEIIDAVDPANTAAIEAREGALKDFEEAIGLRRHVFARERVGRSHLVTLTGMSGSPGTRMPVRRVSWSMAFTDAATRDDMFAWLAVRIDRWDDWGEMAHRKGSDAFTQHLLSLVVASRMQGSRS